MRRTKKLLAMLLCIVMCLSLFPVSVFAEEDAGDAEAVPAAAETVAVAAAEAAPPQEDPPAEPEPVEEPPAAEEPAAEPVEEPAPETVEEPESPAPEEAAESGEGEAPAEEENPAEEAGESGDGTAPAEGENPAEEAGEPGEGEASAEEENPAEEAGEPGDGEAPVEAEETAEPVDGTEADEAEDGEDAEENESAEEGNEDDPAGKKKENAQTEEAKPSVVVLHVISGQPLHFVLTGPEGVVAPATEEELKAYYSGDRTTPAAAEETTTDPLSGEAVPEEEPAAEPAEVAEEIQSAETLETAEKTQPAEPEAEVTEPAEEVQTAEADFVPAEETPDPSVFRADYLLLPGEYTWSAEAKGFRAQKDRSLKVSGEATLEIVLEDAIPYGFKGMPEGWTPSAADLEAKQALIVNDVVSMISQLTPGRDYVEGEIIFPANSEKDAETIARAYSAKLKDYQPGLAKAELTTATVPEALTAAADLTLPLPAVEANLISYLEPDWGEIRAGKDISVSSVEGVQAPTVKKWQDYSFSDPYLKDPTAASYQYMHDIVNTYEAWGVTTGSGVKVAVVDTGVQSDHQDLSGAVTQAGSKTGYTGSHGTHVAGIIAARRNSYGGAGIAPNASILSVRIVESGSSYESYDLANGIRTAANNGAKVINLSLGGSYSISVESALNYAINTKGATVVASMGNEASNNKNFPAGFKIPGLIAVGSVTEARARSAFSSYGSWEDILAPGSAIMSTVPSNTYAFMSGTSMAAPVVSGVCALYLSVYPSATPAQVEKAIKSAKTNSVIDAAKLFTTEKKAPTIDISSTTVTYNSTIYIRPTSASHFVVYTTDGSTPTVKNGEVVKGNVLNGSYGVKITTANGFSSAKKVTIKAISVSGMGVASKVSSKTVTVVGGPGYLPVSSLAISGQSSVAPGKSATYKVSVNPAKATNKSVSWGLSSYTYASIKNGKLTVQAGAPSTTVTVYAFANDGSGVSTSFQVRIRPQITSMRINTPSTPKGGSITYKTDGSPKQITMPSVKFGSKYTNTLNLSVTTEGSTDTKLIWSSSNPKVAKVVSTGTKAATVTAQSAGTVTITAKADDGSGKTAKVTIKVFSPASGVTVKSASKTTYGSVMKLLGVGKKVKNTAVVSDAFGKPTSRKVQWGKRVFVLEDEGWNTLTDSSKDMEAKGLADLTSLVSSGKAWEYYGDGVKVSSSGTVSAAKSLRQAADDYYVVAWVYATTLDGSNLSGGVMYVLANLHARITLEYPGVLLYKSDYESVYTIHIYSQGKSGHSYFRNYTVKSSNPAIVSARIGLDDYGNPCVLVNATGEKKGKAKLTVSATDGSGKKAVCRVLVK